MFNTLPQTCLHQGMWLCWILRWLAVDFLKKNSWWWSTGEASCGTRRSLLPVLKWLMIKKCQSDPGERWNINSVSVYLTSQFTFEITDSDMMLLIMTQVMFLRTSYFSHAYFISRILVCFIPQAANVSKLTAFWWFSFWSIFKKTPQREQRLRRFRMIVRQGGELLHLPPQSLCAVGMIRGCSVHRLSACGEQSNLPHNLYICPCSMYKNPYKHPNDRPDGANDESQKATYFSLLSASLLHPGSHPSPLLTCRELTARGFHWSPHLRLATSTLIILSVQKKASDAFMPTTTPAVFSH